VPENSILGEGDLEMKYRVFVILLILLAIAVTPALAKQIETPISIWSGVVFIDPYTPFYVEHGWTFDDTPPGHMMQTTKFNLYVDGMKCEGKNPYCSPGIPRPINGTQITWEYKFKKGLPPGEHTLHGEYLFICGLYYDPADCVDPEALVVVHDQYLTINPEP
jgi:hypothetical protein